MSCERCEKYQKLIETVHIPTDGCISGAKADALRAEVEQKAGYVRELSDALEDSRKQLQAALLQIDELQKELAFSKEVEMTGDRLLMESNRLNREYLDQIEWAWDVIANAGPEGCLGNWKKLDAEWVKIAENWRDRYHKILDERTASQKPKGAEGICPLCYHAYTDEAHRKCAAIEASLETPLQHVPPNVYKGDELPTIVGTIKRCPETKAALESLMNEKPPSLGDFDLSKERADKKREVPQQNDDGTRLCAVCNSVGHYINGICAVCLTPGFRK